MIEQWQVDAELRRRDRRERYAAAALTGLLANPSSAYLNNSEIIRAAFSWADDMMKGMDETEGRTS